VIVTAYDGRRAGRRQPPIRRGELGPRWTAQTSRPVLEIRELFTTRICLGVTAAVHVDMVLGDGARERGALADEIPLDEDHAGIGFRIDKRSRLPRRLRFGHTTDADIAELVRLCTPTPRLAVVRGTTEGVA